MYDTTTLSLSCSVAELAKHGVTPSEAGKILTDANFYMEKVMSELTLDNYDDDQIIILKSLLVRLFVVDEKNRNDGYVKELVDSFKTTNLVIGHNQTFPVELSITLCARAINKYSDFVFLLMLSESLNVETYNRLLKVGSEEIRKAIGASLSIFEKISGGTVSLMLFSSVLEDALNSTITPVIESIANDSTLRQHFILEPDQLLVPLTMHVAEKVKGAIYLSDALIKVASK